MSTLLVENIRHEDATSPTITLLANGNLGIGTVSPDTQMVVANGTDTFKVNLDSDSIDLYASGKTLNLGTTSNNVVRFFENNEERMRINSGGYVGIGTDNPGSHLHVYTTNNETAFIKIGSISQESGINFDEGTTGKFQFRYRPSQDRFDFYSTTVGGNVMSIKDNTGNVGIGTTNPQTTLQVDGNVSINSTSPDLVGNTTTLTIGNSSGGGDGMLSLQSGWGNTTYGRMFASGGIFKIGNPQSNKLVLYTANLDRLRIDENGRAGWSPDAGSNFYIIHGKDGSSSGNAALSAEEIKRTLGSRAVSGYYWLITPSDGVARQWWCDMETDGGGWILVAHHGDGQLATSPGNWFDSTNAGSFNAHSTGTFKGGGYWRTWGAEHIMIECRTDGQFFNNSAVSKVGFKWGSSNSLPSSSAYYNLPTKTFKDWCWDIYNAPGFDPANYQRSIRDSSVNGNASFTEHFIFSWSPRTAGGPGDDGSAGPYWHIGSHHDSLHQHYEESAGGNGSTGNGGFHVVSNEDTTWSNGGTNYGMQRLYRYNDNSGTVNIWIR